MVYVKLIGGLGNQLFQYSIISNSSFSWWASWLNNNKNIMVIAPEFWFADKSDLTPDLIPHQWIRL